MSHYVTPFLVLNIGAEMVFVVAQRLQAQNVPLDRANLVLDEIISVLISKQLIAELMKPQATYNHEAVRDIVEDVTQSSSMRLDPVSMGKLWDLITMVFKWQLTMSPDLIKLTLRHLYEVETYTTIAETQLQLHKVQNVIDNFNKILSGKERHELRDSTLYWLKDINVRVSLLMRMGLQNVNGAFLVNGLDPIADEMLKNLGENIYAVTNNGRVLENQANANHHHHQPEMEVHELKVFVDQIMGDRKGDDSGTTTLRLSINKTSSSSNSCNDDDNNQLVFNSIEVSTGEDMHGLINDLNISVEEETDHSLTDDLLQMIGGDDLAKN